MRVRSRLRFGWMSGVKVSWGSKGMTVETARQCKKDGMESRTLVYIPMVEFHDSIFAGCVLSGPHSRALLSATPGVGWNVVT